MHICSTDIWPIFKRTSIYEITVSNGFQWSIIFRFSLFFSKSLFRILRFQAQKHTLTHCLNYIDNRYWWLPQHITNIIYRICTYSQSIKINENPMSEFCMFSAGQPVVRPLYVMIFLYHFTFSSWMIRLIEQENNICVYFSVVEFVFVVVVVDVTAASVFYFSYDSFVCWMLNVSALWCAKW